METTEQDEKCPDRESRTTMNTEKYYAYLTGFHSKARLIDKIAQDLIDKYGEADEIPLPAVNALIDELFPNISKSEKLELSSEIFSMAHDL